MLPVRPNGWFVRKGPWLTLLILLNSGYLWAAGTPGLFYVGNVLVHLVLGLAMMGVWAGIGVVLLRRRAAAVAPALSVALPVLTMMAAGTGLALLFLGNLYPQRPLLWTHIAVSFGACLCVLLWFRRQRFFERRPAFFRLSMAVLTLAVAVPLSRPLWPKPAEDVITNPLLPPVDMAGEAMNGADGPFFPSAAETRYGDLIPGDFFLDSKSCGRNGCHTDVTAQWESSAHHFSSFNNQWYRKSIEYMQEVAGTQAPQWCAGCHDHALLFSGQMNRPVADFLDTPEAQAGLGCVSCHSIVHVQSTMGNGDFVLEYPEMHDLATSDNRLVRTLHDFIVRLDPAPHRRVFLKPFHREQPAEFCSSCHKVHLDEPVNRYRWLRGFNTYDNWQASGVSGQGARSFYEPPEPMTCLTCHMPYVPSDDAASKGGRIRSHRFPAANTALPTANRDSVQLRQVLDFLKNGKLRVDLFAVSEPVPLTAQAGEDRGAGEAGGRTASTFAVGEEQARDLGSGGLTREAVQVFAPLTDGAPVLQPGTSVRLDVVVRTLGLGHFFPSGTVDAQEAWLEVKAVDADGRTLLWSGGMETDNGPVDPGAHFYRNLMVDAHANVVNKRNAFATRAVVYVNLIPPGAADVAHYRLQVPEDAGPTVTLTAKLHYRKFDWWHTQFAYVGVPAPGQPDTLFSPHYDDRQWVFEGDLSRVSGRLKAIPSLPIATLAADSVTLAVAATPDTTAPPADDAATLRTRWNDYGIGLLRQGDLKGAEQAFRRVTTLDPTYADGWINRTRVALQEGNLEAAAPFLDAAERVRPGFHKAHYFRGLWHKARGEYDAALKELRAAADAFPTDRVVLNQIGRVHYLDADPAAAVDAFERVLAIDPEDLMAHYNLMLCYRALGDLDRAAQHETRYLRFKADETAQALARRYRQAHPLDNNEALPIHEHTGRTGMGTPEGRR